MSQHLRLQPTGVRETLRETLFHRVQTGGYFVQAHRGDFATKWRVSHPQEADLLQRPLRLAHGAGESNPQRMGRQLMASLQPKGRGEDTHHAMKPLVTAMASGELYPKFPARTSAEAKRAKCPYPSSLGVESARARHRRQRSFSGAPDIFRTGGVPTQKNSGALPNLGIPRHRGQSLHAC